MHANEHLLRDLDQAQIRGDMEAFSGFFVDDVVVHFPGKSSLAGEYKGKDQLFEMFGRWQERTPEFTFDPHAYLANDGHGVCLQFSHYKRGNEQMDSNDVIVYHFRDGKVSEVWLLSYDEDAVDAFLG
jgi:ketosteroid isomerase-like protein